MEIKTFVEKDIQKAIREFIGEHPSIKIISLNIWENSGAVYNERGILIYEENNI